MLLNNPFIEPEAARELLITAIAIRAAISAYSIAVAPEMSSKYALNISHL